MPMRTSQKRENEMKKETLYSVTECSKTLYGQRFTTYGINGRNCSFDDVSTDRAKVEEMVSRMNSQQLEESQFMYFIEDELIR